jgi:hypothetical protein
MPSGVGPRFAAPPRHRDAPARFRAPGLGGQSEPVADAESPELNRLESTTPREGFTGIGSRPRFFAVPRMVSVGHGARQQGDRPLGALPDPATDKSQFVKEPYATGVETFAPNVRTSNIDAESEPLVASGFLRYFRRRIDATVPGDVLQDPNIMGWGKAPFPRALRQPRFTLRPEFEQGAQSFLGLHTVVVKGARMSTSPARMGAPRTNRLTSRAAPGSFGQTTRVMR